MPDFDEADLARLAGTMPDVVTRMVEHGLLPAEGETTLRPDDRQRVELVSAFERSGIPMDVLRAAGRTVNVDARIASQAGPGEVLVGADLVDAAVGSAIRFDLVGPASLKGLDFPVELYRAFRV